MLQVNPWLSSGKDSVFWGCPGGLNDTPKRLGDSQKTADRGERDGCFLKGVRFGHSRGWPTSSPCLNRLKYSTFIRRAFPSGGSPRNWASTAGVCPDPAAFKVHHFDHRLGTHCHHTPAPSAATSPESPPGPKCTISNIGTSSGRHSACIGFEAAIREKCSLGLSIQRVYQDLRELGFVKGVKCLSPQKQKRKRVSAPYSMPYVRTSNRCRERQGHHLRRTHHAIRVLPSGRRFFIIPVQFNLFVRHSAPKPAKAGRFSQQRWGLKHAEHLEIAHV